MCRRIRKGFISFYIVFLMITTGFAGFMVFDGVVDEGSVTAATTRYVGGSGPGNWSKIQDAIDNASAGDMIRVYRGIYYENVIVNKTVSLIGNGTTNTTIDGGGSGDVVNINANGVNITGFMTTNSGSMEGDAGIDVSYTDNCRIEYCNITNNSMGILLYYSSNNTVENNTCTNNSGGIFLYYSSNSTIENNICTNNICGIWLAYSSNNTIEYNICNFNKESGVDDDDNGIQLWYSSYNDIIGNQALYNENNGIESDGSSNNNITGNNLSNNGHDGIEFDGSPNNYIQNNSISNNGRHGICLDTSSNIVLTNNTVSNNNDGIVLLSSSSKNIIIRNNDCSNNNYSGIRLDSSLRNTLINNTCLNNDPGISIYNSYSNTVKNAILKDNPIGIFIGSGSDNCHIINSSIINSTRSDIRLNSNSHAFVLNCSINWSNINYQDTLSNLTVQWYLHANVTNETSIGLSGADIMVKDNFTKRVYQGKTNPMGNCKWIPCSHYVENLNGIIKILTPHNTTAALPMYDEGYADPEPFMDTNKMVSIVLYPDITPPAPATNLVFDIIYGTYINMSWTNSTSHDVEGYYIYINDTGSSTTFHLLNFTSDTYLNVTGLVEETTYYFVINAYDDVMLESTNLTDSTTTPDVTPPIPPTSLMITKIGGTYIELSWVASTSADLVGYEVYVNDTGSTSNFHIITTTTNLNYNHSGLVEETNYYYQVRAFDEVLLYSLFSNLVFATTFDITAPGAPTGLVAQDPTGSTVTLAWDANPEADIEGYHIYINDTGSGSTGPFHWVYSTSGTSTGSTVAGLLEETTYYFVIAAYDEVPNNSTYSDYASATTLDITGPAKPTDFFTDAVYPTAVELKWDFNIETDIAGYKILVNDTNKGSNGPFHEVAEISPTFRNHIVAGLVEETTYHFVLIAFDEVPNYSIYSDVVTITTPDGTAPQPPTNIKVIKPTNSSLTIKWLESIDDDVEGYNIYRGLSSNGEFEKINDELITKLRFVDRELDELTIYYYKITGVDEVQLESDFSEVAQGQTLLGQHAPKINNSPDDFFIPEDKVDFSSIKLHEWFIDINNDVLEFQCSGQEHIKVTIYQGNGTVRLKPEANWNGQERLKFTVSDGMFEISDEVLITVTPVNDPPEKPQIITPNNKVQINIGEKLDFQGKCDDPDLEYGDELTYSWSSDISGVIGEGKSVDNIVLPIGNHKITLEVSDKGGYSSKTTIRVTVQETSKTDSDTDGIPNVWEDDNGLNPFDSSDANKDYDGDGLSNLEEYIKNTEPRESDTDGDGYNDKDDLYPLDSTKWRLESGEKDKEKTGLIGLILVIIIIIIVVLLLFLFVLKPRMVKKVESEDETSQKTPALKAAPETPKLLYPQTQLQQPIPPHYTLQTSYLTQQETKPEISEIKDLLEQGSIAYSQGRYTDAILAWQQVLEKEPGQHPDIEMAIKDALGNVKNE